MDVPPGLQPALGRRKSVPAFQQRVPNPHHNPAMGLPECTGITGITPIRIENRAGRKNIRVMNKRSIASHVS
jgi:hypothetical protein